MSPIGDTARGVLARGARSLDGRVVQQFSNFLPVLLSEEVGYRRHHLGHRSLDIRTRGQQAGSRVSSATGSIPRSLSTEGSNRFLQKDGVDMLESGCLDRVATTPSRCTPKRDARHAHPVPERAGDLLTSYRSATARLPILLCSGGCRVGRKCRQLATRLDAAIGRFPSTSDHPPSRQAPPPYLEPATPCVLGKRRMS